MKIAEVSERFDISSDTLRYSGLQRARLADWMEKVSNEQYQVETE